ncbi:bifunctional tetrahydrofolate synthase/dihydrofolate synthase [Gynuella sunshinyii]|uniref:Dihydrofolate synthase/folylpolyglutamate synthase n=1 Tax=Gynuella sunshinyii YC6258 TaxID=1445510 RepID=A0A0C5VJZ1_9GAMM|nr:bifunctional tetrahydrofolate synthase/dihydrofolate synthase [Gynuella sunshinyii]AJQ94992.1 folylpolyglutamate synthase [Gynuella sunshinyii YC6258]
MSLKTLSNWLSYLESLHHQEIDLGLERVGRVAELLNIDKGKATVFTVAGTNGKGSSCAFLDTILTIQGYRTGRYSSPHILRFNERVLLNGQEVDDLRLVRAFEQIEQSRDGISLSYFEYTTLAAMLIFQQADLDVWILEVGLGGRLDAVNIIDPDVALVTSIALDHQDWLGSDLVQIGREKAGIFRTNGLAVCGQQYDVEGVVERAVALDCRFHLKARDFKFEYSPESDEWCWRGKNAAGDDLVLEHLPLPQLPLENAATVIQALYLSGLNISVDSIAQGMRRARLSGRFQALQYQQHRLILDVAHNPQAATMLVQRLRAEGILHPVIIVGMLADKDCRRTLEILAAAEPVSLVCIDLNVPRGQSALKLAEFVPDNIRAVMKMAPDVVSALNGMVMPGPEDIVVCGSFYTVSQAMQNV